MCNHILFYIGVGDLTQDESLWLDEALYSADSGVPHGLGLSYDRPLWVYSEGQGTVDDHIVATRIVRAFLAKFRPDETWVLEQGGMCDHPIAGRSGDGWAIVTATMITWGSTPEALAHVLGKTGAR